MLRKLARVIFNVLAALSLLLCVGAAVLWPRSYRVHDSICAARRGGLMWWAGSTDGRWRIVAASGWPCDEPLRAARVPISEPDDMWWPPMTVAKHTAPQWEGFDIVVYADRARAVLTADGRRAIRPAERRLHLDAIKSEPLPRLIVGGPFWAPVTVFALAPVAWLATRGRRIFARRRRSRAGRCPACGYDLTGNASGVCPECGTPVSKGVKP